MILIKNLAYLKICPIIFIYLAFTTVVIFFPKEKVEAVINCLQSCPEFDDTMVNRHLHFLRERSKTTKKSIAVWTQNSHTLRRIFGIVIEVLNSAQFNENPYSEYLKQAVEKFINGK